MTTLFKEIKDKPVVIRKRSKVPTEAGWYFVKDPDWNYWGVLVRLSGKLPLLTPSNVKTLFKVDDDHILKNEDLVWSDRIILTKDEEEELSS